MFEKFVETLNTTGKTVSERTKQGSEVVRANLKIAAEERALTDLYTKIGKLYFENNADSPCCETMGELFQKVNEKRSSIEALKHQIRVIKGVVICDNCGAEADLDNDYCGKCGAKLVKPEPPAEVEEAAPETEAEAETESEEAAEADINIKVAEEDPFEKPSEE